MSLGRWDSLTWLFEECTVFAVKSMRVMWDVAMNEAERFLEKKMRRAEPSARQPVAGDAPSTDQRDGVADRMPGGPPPTAQTKEAGGKGWGVVMGVFAILATMFWMAVFKGGCR